MAGTGKLDVKGRTPGMNEARKLFPVTSRLLQWVINAIAVIYFYCLPDIFICILGILFSSVLTATAGDVYYRWPWLKIVWLNNVSTLLWCKSDMHSVGTILWILSLYLFLGYWHKVRSPLLIRGGCSKLHLPDSRVVTRVNYSKPTTILDPDTHPAFHFQYGSR